MYTQANKIHNYRLKVNPMVGHKNLVGAHKIGCPHSTLDFMIKTLDTILYFD